jgi:methylated-DNA-[protein]-cysteine S-methyltransferase
MDRKYTTVDSPAGRLLLAGVAGRDGTVLDTITFADTIPSGHVAEPAAFAEVTRQLAAYFAGSLTGFALAHTDRGTPFQNSVWAAVEAIPYGETISYGELADRVGAPRDRIRAVAAAVGANPLLVVRPCHRVIGADGSLTGYAGGVARKRSLLVHEGALQPELV